MPVRRASRNITLVLIGSAASLAACTPDVEPSYQRDHYASIEDCAADWGRPESCEPASGDARSGGNSGYYYRGPIYSTRYRNDAQIASREQARSEGRSMSQLAPSDRSVARSGPAGSGPRASSGGSSRGGFGSSSRSFSSMGS